ncbi:MAG TPA: hypothetical protein EYQ61_07155 [Dehalococcoidia bacterium]|nr:hypothetical protein [Dehalococcoidia bacterium]HIK89210.1 hypothetical protein [Dehalococcoidia bacterium]
MRSVVQYRVKFGVLAAISVTVLLLLSACGSSEPPASIERVVDDSRIFIIDDLRSSGMKASKHYDVTDLPGGVDAWYGFIQTDSGPMDIEVRFYSSHADAVALGTELAEAVSGDDADIEEDTTPWTVGYKDRQRMRSGGTADLAAWSGQRGPNYADFVIYGNMVLLCQGDEPLDSIKLCHKLITAVVGDEDSGA